MRFDSEGHLENFRAGCWPAIHERVYRAAVEYGEPAFLDLCCSTGLLGERLRRDGYQVLGVERDEKAVALGRAYGVALRVVPMPVVRRTMGALMRLVQGDDVRTVLARRCLPELFGEDAGLGEEFGRRLRAAGVRRVVLEGRKSASRSRHPLRSVDLECDLLAGSYRVLSQDGDVAVLDALP